MTASLAVDADDWLSGSAGSVVESEDGRIGRVDEVRRDPGSGRPVALVVRAGMAGRRRLVVSVDDIAGVLPGSGRIILGRGWVPVDEAEPAA